MGGRRRGRKEGERGAGSFERIRERSETKKREGMWKEKHLKEMRARLTLVMIEMKATADTDGGGRKESRTETFQMTQPASNNQAPTI